MTTICSGKTTKGDEIIYSSFFIAYVPITLAFGITLDLAHTIPRYHIEGGSFAKIFEGPPLEIPGAGPSESVDR
jgi:hypothetical protein